MNFTVDRFESDFAVVQTPGGSFFNVPRGILPPETKEGDIITIYINYSQTKEVQKRIENKMNSLFSD